MRLTSTVFLALTMVCVVVAALWPASVDAAGRGEDRSAGKSVGKNAGRDVGRGGSAPAKNEKYIVVRVGEPTGTGELRVIQLSELRSLEKSIKDEDKKLSDDYKAKKKEAIKNKESVVDLGDPPVKRRVSKVGPTFKTQDEAEKWKEDHPDKADIKKVVAR